MQSYHPLRSARALDCFVKGCADLFLTDAKGRVCLGKRKVHPQPDWWLLGGRMKAGDTIQEAAVGLVYTLHAVEVECS